MPTATRGDKRARREDILEAARAIVGEVGVDGLQVRAVAQRAGVALGTVYTYFTTKESLHAALYAEALDGLLADLEAARIDQGDLEETFVRFATGYRRMYARYGRDFDPIAALTGSAVEPGVLEQLANTTTRLMSLVREVLRQHGAQEPDVTLVVLWSTATGLAEHFTGPRHVFHGLSWDDTVRFAARTFVRGLLLDERTQS